MIHLIHLDHLDQLVHLVHFGTAGTLGTLGTDGTSPSLSMSFLTLAAVPWDNPVSFSILDNDVYTFGKCRFIKPCHSKMKDKT